MANNDDSDDFPSQVEAMADRLGLTGKGRQSYIRDHMTAADYDEVPTYVKRKAEGSGSGDGEGNDDKSFTGRYGGKTQQEGKGKGQRAQRRGGNASWYDE